MANLRPLTPKQQRFAEEYLVDGNGTQAAIRAGCRANSAKVTASKWLRLANIQAAVSLGREVAPGPLPAVTPRVVLTELLRIATVDLAQAYTPEGQLKPIHEMPEDVRRAIAGIEVEELFSGRGEERSRIGEIRKVKFWDKPKALELLGKHLKLFTDRVEHDVSKSLEQLIAESMK